MNMISTGSNNSHQIKKSDKLLTFARNDLSPTAVDLSEYLMSKVDSSMTELPVVTETIGNITAELNKSLAGGSGVQTVFKAILELWEKNWWWGEEKNDGLQDVTTYVGYRWLDTFDIVFPGSKFKGIGNENLSIVPETLPRDALISLKLWHGLSNHLLETDSDLMSTYDYLDSQALQGKSQAWRLYQLLTPVVKNEVKSISNQLLLDTIDPGGVRKGSPMPIKELSRATTKSIEVINKFTSLYVSVYKQREGKRIKAWLFTVKRKENFTHLLQGDVIQEASDLNSKQIKLLTEIEQDFDVVWRYYPKKVRKKDAKRFFEKSILNGEKYEDILKGVQQYGEFILNPPSEPLNANVFFRQEIWKHYQ